MDAATQLNLIFSEVQRSLEKPQDHFSDTSFDRGIEAWCKVLDWPQEVVTHAKSLGRKYVFQLGFRRFSDKGGLECGEESVEVMSKMEPKDYLWIALLAAAFGYVIYKNTRPRIQQAHPKRGPRAQGGPRPQPRADRWTLVLVVNAAHTDILDSIRSDGVASLDGDQLYQSTQALWFGPDDDFGDSTLSPWFDDKRQVASNSEYDVHLIRFKLDGDDPGLHRDANMMDRLDAFRRLKAKNYKSEVSPRLPSEAYGTTDVYTR